MRCYSRFAIEAEKADWALVYFAGQGFLRDAKSFLVEIDARLESVSDIRSLTLDDAMRAVRGARKLRLAIVDICQDDPFDKDSKL